MTEKPLDNGNEASSEVNPKFFDPKEVDFYVSLMKEIEKNEEAFKESAKRIEIWKRLNEQKETYARRLETMIKEIKQNVEKIKARMKFLAEEGVSEESDEYVYVQEKLEEELTNLENTEGDLELTNQQSVMEWASLNEIIRKEQEREALKLKNGSKE